MEIVSAQLQAVTKAQIRHVFTPDGEDINSLTLSHSPEILSHLIENAAEWEPVTPIPPGVASPGVVTPGGTFLFSFEKEENSEPSESASKLPIISPELLIYKHDHLKIAVLGGVKLTGLDRLRATLKITNDSNAQRLPIRHNLDLYHAVQSEQLQAKISENFNIENHKVAMIIEGADQRTGKLPDTAHGHPATEKGQRSPAHRSRKSPGPGLF